MTDAHPTRKPAAPSAAASAAPNAALPAFTAFLGLRFLAFRKINLIGVVGIGVAVWAMIFVVALFSGLIADIRGSVRRASPDLLCTHLPTDCNYDDLAARLLADEDVVATAPRLRHYALYFPHGPRTTAAGGRTDDITVQASEFQFVELTGIDPAAEVATSGLLDSVRSLHDTAPESVLHVPPAAVRRWEIESGQTVPDGAPVGDRPGILFGSARYYNSYLSYAERLSVRSASFRAALDGGPAELIPEQQFAYLAGIFETGHRVFDQTKALVDIHWLSEDMLGREFFEPLTVTDVAIEVRDGVDLQIVATRLERMLAADLDARCLTWEQQNKVYLDAVDQERALMKLVLIVVLLVSAFLVYVTLTMMVAQKTREIGILASLGASRRGVLQLFLFTGGTIAVVGCTVGTVAGHLFVAYANTVDDYVSEHFGTSLFPAELYSLEEIPFELDPWWSVQVVVGALLVAGLATWLPARRAARFTPVKALAHE